MSEIEFVNIREGCAYLHPRSRKKATQAARILIGNALVREAGPDIQSIPENALAPVTLVVGEGESGAICQSELSDLGLKAHRVKILSGKIIRAGGKFSTISPDGSISGDCLVLAPASGAELDYLAGSIQMTNQRPFVAGQSPSGSRQLGLFLCPPSLDSGISGRGAAGEILGWMGRMRSRSLQPAASVDPNLCRSCGTCLEVCGLGIPDRIVDQSGSYAWINPFLCLDCGTCSAHCPSGAIQPGLQTDRYLVDILERALV
jgi:heterodisulfide reductase subunit A-like polyferredoxin